MRILAIDPGPEESAVVEYDKGVIQTVGMLSNEELIGNVWIFKRCPILAIEMIKSYGMPAGDSLFETCVWIGRFFQVWHVLAGSNKTEGYFRARHMLIPRKTVVAYICGNARGKDANVRQAIIDVYRAKHMVAHDKEVIGTKQNPGPLYGVKNDIWQALALAIYCDNVVTGEEMKITKERSF